MLLACTTLLVEPDFHSVVGAEFKPRGLLLVGMDPGARVSHALLPAQGLEQIHYPGALGVEAGRCSLPFHALRFAVSGGKDYVEQFLVVLALLQVGAGDLPGGDVVGPGLDVFEGGFRRFARVGIRRCGEDILQRRLAASACA